MHEKFKVIFGMIFATISAIFALILIKYACETLGVNVTIIRILTMVPGVGLMAVYARACVPTVHEVNTF